MTPRLSNLLARLEPVVREEMLKVAVPNCCIATVAVLCRVFKHFGYRAKGIPASVVIRNPTLVKYIAQGVPLPDDPEALRKWMLSTGSWCIGIVPESAEESLMRGVPGFGGHLVCQVQDVLVDASLCQANRPKKQIVLPKFFTFPAAPRFLNGDGMLVGVINGCEVEYRPLRNGMWRKAVDWHDEKRYRGAVNAIIARTEPA